MNKKHIVFFSGGLGSWLTAKRVVKAFGAENTVCLFTDTLIEDADLYRFMLETTADIYGVNNDDLIARCAAIPETSHETQAARKDYLAQLAADATERNPSFVWLNIGKDPWDIFFEKRFLGNSRIAQCSHTLKQRMASDYIKAKYGPDDCVLYLGIDWTEEHRTKAPRKNWAPYPVEFPMCEEPLLTKIDAIKALEEAGIEAPRLYAMDFSHNNCGGFCVRAGQGHFVNLLEKNPALYRYHEDREQEIRAYLGKDVAMLKRTRNKVTRPLTLRELREEYEAGSKQIDMTDIGGCGCFVSDDGEAN